MKSSVKEIGDYMRLTAELYSELYRITQKYLSLDNDIVGGDNLAKSLVELSSLIDGLDSTARQKLEDSPSDLEVLNNKIGTLSCVISVIEDFKNLTVDVTFKECVESHK